MQSTLSSEDGLRAGPSSTSSVGTPTGGHLQPDHDHASITPGEIAIGVIIGRASEYFDFFVYAIALL